MHMHMLMHMHMHMHTFSSESPPQPGAVKPSVLRLTAWRWHLGWG